MFNLVKMNFYRLFHQKSFYVCIGVTVLIGWFMVFLVWMTPVMEEKAREARALAQEGRDTAAGDFQTGFFVGFSGGEDDEYAEAAPVLEEFNVSDFACEFCYSGFNVILLSVVVSLFVNSEQKRGYIKNLGGQIKPRGMFIAAKLPVILFEVIAVYAAALLSFALFGRIYYNKFTWGDAAGAGKILLLQILLGVALGALVMLFCTIARNAAAGILVGVAVNMTSILYDFISRLAVAYLGAPEGFSISTYTVEYYLMNAVEASDTARAVTVGLVYLLVAAGLGWLFMEKRDIA